jgi:hypothetical protein
MWLQHIERIFWREPISHEHTFQLIIFFVENGCLPKFVESRMRMDPNLFALRQNKDHGKVLQARIQSMPVRMLCAGHHSGDTKLPKKSVFSCAKNYGVNICGM